MEMNWRIIVMVGVNVLTVHLIMLHVRYTFIKHFSIEVLES